MVELKFEMSDEFCTDEVKDFILETHQCIDLYAKKNHDYGNSFDKGMSTIGIAYGLGRIYDKVNRLINLSNSKSEQQVKNESIDDTLMDLACYSIMMLVYRKKELNHKQQQINFE